MKNFVKVSIAAAALAGATVLGGVPAKADGFTIGVGPRGGINFSYSSGGYCDEFGCPDTFWDMPVYYCPVFYRGGWYRGPVYYRQHRGRTQFWIRGGWRYDEWRRDYRPSWACTDRFGPALGFEYYDRHGFRMRDEWRDHWRRHRHGPVPPPPPRPHFGPVPHGPVPPPPPRPHFGPVPHGPVPPPPPRPHFGPVPHGPVPPPPPPRPHFGPDPHNPPQLAPSRFGPGSDRFGPGPDRRPGPEMRRDAPHPPAMGPQGGQQPNTGNQKGGPWHP